MNKRYWGIIFIVLSLIIIIGLVYFLWFYKPELPNEPIVNEPAPRTSEQPVVENDTVPLVQNQPMSSFNKLEVTKDDLGRMAAAFSERFGSFSNQSDYGNIRDLQIFMTEKMKDWARDYINEARARKTDSSIYYGIVTKALASEIKQFDEEAGLAEIQARTQRRESTGVSANSSTFYQDIIIKYVKDKGVWKVDGAYWQSR